jgi:hypothetical protein
MPEEQSDVTVEYALAVTVEDEGQAPDTSEIVDAVAAVCPWATEIRVNRA